MSLITATSLSKSFGAEDIFRGVTFSVPKGARLAIVGPNGCGKTTLLRILIGDEEASSGTVARARSARIGYLSQEADFQMEGTLWEACLSPFASLIQQQDELHRLESQMTDADEEVLARYGKLQHDLERRGGDTYGTRIKMVLRGLGFDASDYDMRLGQVGGREQGAGEKGTRALSAREGIQPPVGVRRVKAQARQHLLDARHVRVSAAPFEVVLQFAVAFEQVGVGIRH